VVASPVAIPYRANNKDKRARLSERRRRRAPPEHLWLQVVKEDRLRHMVSAHDGRVTAVTAGKLMVTKGVTNAV
jgi:hypothetical protein